MNRCLLPARRAGPAVLPVLLAAALAAPPFARAQADTTAASSGLAAETAVGGRNFPVDALRGRLRVIEAPDIRLDGREDRLSPGARIRDARNLLVVSSAIAGQDLLVNYTRDAAGLVREVWVLTPEEASVARATAARPLLGFWPFAASTGPRDDGRTPFADLPSYGQ